MKKILAVVVAVFAFNVLAGAPPAGDAKPADKSAKKAPAKKGDEKAPKADAGTAM